MRMPLASTVAALAALLLLAGPSAAAPSSGPLRIWSVSALEQGVGEVQLAGGSQPQGALDRSIDLGRVALHPRGQDDRASAEVSSTASGARSFTSAEAPSLDPSRPRSAKGGVARLDSFQAYVKQEKDASLRISITGVLLQAIDANGRTGCPASTPCPPIRTLVRFRAHAYAASGDFFDAGGTVYLQGNKGQWVVGAATGANARAPFWKRAQFDVDGGKTGTDASLELHRDDPVKAPEPVKLTVPLGSIRSGELFAVHVQLESQAINDRGGESYAGAFIRDPQGLEAGLSTRGLEPRGAPRFKEPPAQPRPGARCPAGASSRAGTVQLDGSAYSVGEGSGTPMALVTRTGGSHGATRVTLATSGGSALAGQDFTSTRTRVRFEDGDSSPRLVEIPIREDLTTEFPESFRVSLTDARCAKLGTARTASVTIVDDDQSPPPPPPPAPTFTIGGTVDGLQGSGLVLSNLGAELPVSANGSFTLPGTHTGGEPYEVNVTSQPRNPDQLCTVQNGAGQVGNADVTDIAVHCETTPVPAGLDATFGSGGRVTVPGNGDGQAVVIQPDGHIVTAGPREVGVNFHFDFGASRHDASGNLDPGFGSGGIATTDLGGNEDKATDAALLPDGGFVTVGQADPAGLANPDFGLVRYSAEGQPVPAFDGDGVVTEDIAGRSNAANAVAVQPDGKIVVAGFALPNNAVDLDFALARYNPDGTLDTSFDGDGIVTTNLGTQSDDAVAVAIQPDGKIVAVGNTDNGVGVARYQPNGALDTTFNTTGTAVNNLGMDAHGATLTPAGNIMVAGAGIGPNATSDVKVADYDPDGKLHLGFGQLGVVDTDLSGGFDSGDDLVVDAGGRIVVVGRATSPTVTDMALVRYMPDGKLDTGFDGDGILTADFKGTGDFGHDVAIDSQGRIVAAGTTGDQFALMRVNP